MRFLHRRRIEGTYWRIREKKLKTFPCQECNLSSTSLSYLTKVHARTETQPRNNAFGMFPIRQNFCRKKAISHDTYKRHTLDKKITSAYNVRKLWSQVVHWGSTCEYTQDKNPTNAANVWSHLRKITLWIIRRFMPGSGFSPAFTVKNQWWPKETFEDPLIKEHNIMDL